MDWDRTRKWCVTRREVGRRHLLLRFPAGAPTLRDIAAIRRTFAELAHASPAALRSMIGTSAELDLGERSTIEASSLIGAAEHAGLTVVARNASRVEFSITDATGPLSYYCLIEDEDELRQTALEMIAAGVQVVDVAED